MLGMVQITVPPASTALTSLATAKADLNISDVYADDAYITRLIDRASSIVAGYCGRVFGKQTLAESFRMAGRNSASYVQAVATFGTPLNPSVYNPILLTQLPVVSITSVVEGGVTLSPTDYDYDPITGIVYRLFGGVRSAWVSPLTVVTYQGGYVLPTDDGTVTLPPAVEEVVLSLVRGAYFVRGGDPRLITEIVEGVGRNTYADPSAMSGMQIDENSAAILAPYKSRVW